MRWFNNLKPDTITKILFIVFFVAVGAAVFLTVKLLNPSSTVFNGETALAADPWEPPTSADFECRYRTNGGTCAPAEFRSGACSFLKAGEMCFCNGGDTQGANGWTYARVNKNETTPRCLRQSVDEICANRGSEELITTNFEQTTCGNVLRCNPKAPPVTTQPPATPGKIRIETVCVDGPTPSGARFDLGVTAISATTGGTVGSSNGSLNIGSGRDVTISGNFPVYANLDARNISNGLWVSNNGCDGRQMNDGGSCRLEFKGCQTSTPPTITDTPPITPPVTTPPTITPNPINLTCTGLSITNSAGTAVTASQLNPGEKYRLQVNTSNSVRYATRYFYKIGNGAYTLINNPDQNPANCSTKGNNFNDQYSPQYVDFTVPATAAGQSISFRSANVFKIVNGVLTKQPASACPDNDNSSNIVTCGVPGAGAFRVAPGGYNTNQAQYAAQLALLNNATCSASTACERAFTVTPRQITQTPNIEITKVRVSPDYQPVGSSILFNISVRNTGNVDIRNFALSDEYDPTFLQFVSLRYRNTTIAPDNAAGVMIGANRRLTWSNMPPKSNVVAGEDGILTVGEINTFTAQFTILGPSSANNLEKNRNCGLVTTLTYRDNLGQNVQLPLNPPRQSCDTYHTPTPNPLRVIVSKTSLTPRVVSPGRVSFRATITNNDVLKRTYTDIDFTDTYEREYLAPYQVIITNPQGRRHTIDSIPNTGSIVITDIQSKLDSSNVALGALAFNQTYTIELIYNSLAPKASTCDTVYANVTDNAGNGGVSNQAQACAEIVPPIPPKTGANFWLNLVLPGIAIIISGAANFLMLKKN